MSKFINKIMSEEDKDQYDKTVQSFLCDRKALSDFLFEKGYWRYICLEDLPGEQWGVPQVKKCGTHYQASNYGRVKSLSRIVDRRGRWYMSIQERILRQSVNRKGYLRVRFSENGDSIDYSVHQLVGLVFHENTLGLPQINHINTIKHDNTSPNLQWSTDDDNQEHAKLNGLRNGAGNGVNHPRASFSQRQIQSIIKADKEGVASSRLALKYNVSHSTIRRLITGKTYSKN
jgi:hypothetical protein